MFNYTSSWNGDEVSIMMGLRVILKGILKAYFRLICSLMKSGVILATKYKTDSFCSLYMGHRIFGALLILCMAWFKGEEKNE